jgi:hypothetical protein
MVYTPAVVSFSMILNSKDSAEVSLVKKVLIFTRRVGYDVPPQVLRYACEADSHATF